MHLRLEVGRWRLQVWRSEPDPEPDSGPAMVVDHPQPIPAYADRVGFYMIPDETDSTTTPPLARRAPDTHEHRTPRD